MNKFTNNLTQTHTHTEGKRFHHRNLYTKTDCYICICRWVPCRVVYMILIHRSSIRWGWVDKTKEPTALLLIIISQPSLWCICIRLFVLVIFLDNIYKQLMNKIAVEIVLHCGFGVYWIYIEFLFKNTHTHKPFFLELNILTHAFWYDNNN